MSNRNKPSYLTQCLLYLESLKLSLDIRANASNFKIPPSLYLIVFC